MGLWQSLGGRMGGQKMFLRAVGLPVGVVEAFGAGEIETTLSAGDHVVYRAYAASGGSGSGVGRRSGSGTEPPLKESDSGPDDE